MKIPKAASLRKTLVCILFLAILEREAENMGVGTKKRKGMTAVVLLATPCTKSLGCESEGHKHGGRKAESEGQRGKPEGR